MTGNTGGAGAETELLLGARVGARHRIVKHLASGGMGHVFLAKNVASGQLAAVKVAPFDSTPQLADRMLEEAAILSGLDHPNIVRVLEIGSLDDESPYVLMEYVPGTDLSVAMSRPTDAGRTLPLAETLRVLAEVASAIDYIHVRGIVHRDIKPSNVLLDRRTGGSAKLIDFGIAVRRGGFDFANARVGTPGYMAPEQAAGESCGPAADLYALGALSLELLTGKPPRGAISEVVPLGSAALPRAFFARGWRGDADALDAVFSRALARDPGMRFETASGFVAALAAAFQAG